MTSEEKERLRREIIRAYTLNPQASKTSIVGHIEFASEQEVLLEIRGLLEEGKIQMMTRVTQPLLGRSALVLLSWEMSRVRLEGGTEACLKAFWDFCRKVNIQRSSEGDKLKVLVQTVWQSTGNVPDKRLDVLCDGVTMLIQYRDASDLLRLKEVLTKELAFFGGTSFSDLIVVKR